MLLWSCQSLATNPGSGNGIIVSNGLVNLGNTCYLNAQLQCAYHVPLVRDLILEEDEDMDEEASPSLLALRDVFASMTVAVSSLSSSKPSPSTASTDLNNTTLRSSGSSYSPNSIIHRSHPSTVDRTNRTSLRSTDLGGKGGDRNPFSI